MFKPFAVSLTVLLIAFSHSALAKRRTNLFRAAGDELFTTETFTTTTTTTIMSTKGTPCYTTTTSLPECRRKRGMEEKPEIIGFHEDSQDVAPSEVLT